ncbi:hypothetical protein JOC36_000257 [Weissella uvarum]|uniref:restriction endonuclease PLD domain-containing protein n=1 Tax=Weissella uvarum TaxID=1479233 RepID=UPI001EF75546|nr:restriction endonuclease PLD domain-containing protein [Weissella uvarum]MBM7616724.1 hypothetical protein [Weissella uvarum]
MQKSFESETADIGNTPHDIVSEFGNDRVGIGIKTWLSSAPSFQKVMQLKSYKDEIAPYIDKDKQLDLAYKISNIKNDKLDADYKRLGLNEKNNIYHYVTRDEGVLKLYETSYPKVDLDNLKPEKYTKSSFTFNDGVKQYKYTFGDSQIWMYFSPNLDDTKLLETIPVNMLKDPFVFMDEAFGTNTETSVSFTTGEESKRDYLYLPLYSYRDKTVHASSGLNAFNALPKNKGSEKPRPAGEAYIPIPFEVWKKEPHWVDPNIDMSDYASYKSGGNSSYAINLHMPDGQVFEAIFAQQGFKSLQTNPQSILGMWILNALGINNPQREIYNEPAQEIVTMDLLEKMGFDSVKLWHEDPNNLKEVWIDFAQYGSFERFMNNETQTEGE